MTTGTVSSSNLTSLYSNTTNFTAGVVNSSVYSVNGGTGVIVNPTTGNVVVNIGQDVSTSASVQFANVTATGNLSNNYYTLTNAVGIAGQVLTTDGLGVTTWTTPSSLGLVSSVSGTGAGISVSPTTGAVVVSNTGVTSIVAGTGISVSGATGAVTVNATGSNTTYNIDASTVSGGANFNLVGSDATTDTIKFAAGTNMSVVRTDANTITISTVADNIPDGTARGQVLFWDGSAWTASSNIRSATANDRLIATYENSSAGSNAALFLRKDYGATNYTDANNDGVSLNYSLTSTSQGINTYGSVSFEYSPTDPQYVIASSTDNFATPAANLLLLQKSTADLYAPNITLNSSQTGVPTLNASITVDRGSGTNAKLTWNESAIPERWEFTNDLLVEGDLAVNGETLKINANNTASVDSNIYFNGTSQYLKWNYTDQQFELSDTLFISQSDQVAIFERKKTTADLEYEGKTTLKSVMRVTDAASNATDDGGSNILFSRTSGASGGPEVLYGSFQFDYYGTNNTAEAKIVWTNDNFAEPSPGSFPSTYLLQQWNEGRSKFINDSLFVNYAAQGITHTATSIITSNTLVFGSAHGYTANDRIIYTSTTQNGLTQNTYYYVLSTGLTATQCQLGLSPTTNGVEVAVALTNGTGLTLVFADLINRVGVNTSNPLYTLDVNGEANVETTLTVPSITTLTGDNLNITAFSGRDVTISTTLATDPVTIVRNTSATGSGGIPVRTLSLRLDSTNTPVVGFGNQIDFETETTPNTIVQTGYITNQSTGDTAGVLDEFKMTFGVMSAGVSTNRMELDHQGNLQIDGDLAVDGGDITSTASPFNLLNQPTTVNAFTASTITNIGSTVSGTTTIGYDLVVNNNVDADQYTVDSLSTYNTQTTNTSLAGTPVSISATTRVSQKAIIKIIDNVTGEVHMLEALAFRSGTAGFLTTYAEMYSSVALATFTVTGTGGFTTILANPISSNSTTFTVARISLD